MYVCPRSIPCTLPAHEVTPSVYIMYSPCMQFGDLRVLAAYTAQRLPAREGMCALGLDHSARVS